MRPPIMDKIGDKRDFKMQNYVSKVDEKYIEILTLNYENLHKSLWENHKVSWTVTGLFLPLLFGLQGYLIKEYASLAGSAYQIIGGVFVIESLVVVWWLMMQLFSKYNRKRRNRLKEIENFFEDYFKAKGHDQNIHPIKQYSISYGRYTVPGINLNIWFNRIYYLVLLETTAVNAVMVYRPIKDILYFIIF
jgi:hypothetical protein